MAVIPGITNEMVLNAMFNGMPDDQRAVLCSVYGDPSTADPKAWGGTPWRLGTPCGLRLDRNNYVAISAFLASPQDNRFRRRKDQFSATYAVMVDDLGTKLPLAALPTSLIPSLVVETSPGNFQATFFLDRPLEEQTVAEDGIRQMIAQLTGGGVDPGMAGVTRVLRLPGGVNGKPKYMDEAVPWTCLVHVWRPDIRTCWDDLARAFGMVSRTRIYKEPQDGVMRERIRGYHVVLRALKALRLVKREGRWVDIQCPWLAEHTDRANTGAAVAPPAQANGYFGGFKCHHGHCEQRNWGDLEDMAARLVWTQGQRTRGPFYGADE